MKSPQGKALGINIILAILLAFSIGPEYGTAYLGGCMAQVIIQITLKLSSSHNKTKAARRIKT